MRNLYLHFSICILLSGCLVGPNYIPPEPPICDDWISEFVADNLDLSPCDAPPIDWWQLFNDPLLNQYIEMAALFNNNILNAEANICQARALRVVVASDLFPHLMGDMNATRTYFSKNGPVFAFVPGGQNPGSLTTGLPFQLQFPQTQNLYNSLIDATWEIDLFGKRRRSVEAADANIGATIEERNAVLVSILAEVAINYMELRGNQNLGVLIEENIGLLEENARLIAKQFEVGYINNLNPNVIEAQLAQALAALPNVLAHMYRNIYALSVLTGNLPEALLEELLPIQPLPTPPQTITVGMRSDLLRRRPDVRKAERDLAAATANIGVAAASFFPTFTLIGDVGFQSLSLNNLFQAKSLTWALEGDVSIPIFHGGKLVGNLRANEAQAAALAFTYQQAVLMAIQEAESGIVLYAEDTRAVEKLAVAVERYRKFASLTNERYTKGLVSLTDWINAKQIFNSAEQSLLASETTALIDLIALYKALGGGWQPTDCL